MVIVRTLLSWQRIRVTGHSMTPSLLPGDWLLVRHGAPVTPGSVVLARFGSRPDLLVVKRAVERRPDGWWLGSDNAVAGSDSRDHGTAEVLAVAVRLWPRGAGRATARRRWLGAPLPPSPEGL